MKPSSIKTIPLFVAAFFVAACLFFSGVASVLAQEPAIPRVSLGTDYTIEPNIEYDALMTRADLVEVLATLKKEEQLAGDLRFDPEIWAKDIRFTRDLWCLQFRFKPVRIVHVDIPNKEGSFDKKAVWYLMYSVKNLGPSEIEETPGKAPGYKVTRHGSTLRTTIAAENDLPIVNDTTAVADVAEIPVAGSLLVDLVPEEERVRTEKQIHDTPLTLRNQQGQPIPQTGPDMPILFEPLFYLASDSVVLSEKTEIKPEDGKLVTYIDRGRVAYLDRFIPLAIPQIKAKEGIKPDAVLETTVTFSQKPIESGEERWGVAMWMDVDPTIHEFSIYASGLTNAYTQKDDNTNTGKAGEGRTMKQRVLKMNFWRTGDQYRLSDEQFQYGFPGKKDDFDAKNPGDSLLRHNYEWLYL